MPGSEYAAEPTFAPGSVTLATVPGGSSVLGDLPEAAFENLLVVAAGTSVRDVQREVESRGSDPRKVGVVPVSGTGSNLDTPLWTARRVDPSDLTGISIEVSRGMDYVKPGEGWVVVDSASVLAMYAQPERLVRLLASIASACRGANARFVIAITESVLDDETTTRLAGIADQQVDFD